MSILGWIVLGLIAGVIAKSLLGGRAQHGIIVTIVIGIAGALLGGWAASKFFGIAATGGFFDLSTWIGRPAADLPRDHQRQPPIQPQVRLLHQPPMTGSPNGRRGHRIPPPEPSARQDTRIMTSFEPEPVPHTRPDPGLVELTPTDRASPLAEAEDREQRRWNRTRAVGMICLIINIICGVFAVVLAAQIIMVLGEANPANGVAAFVRGFASGVSLGFDNLFTPDNAKTQVLLNDGLAALVWLGLAAVLTMLIRRFALPGPRRPLRYVTLPRRRYVDPTAPR